jgi:hypothetical protein
MGASGASAGPGYPGLRYRSGRCAAAKSTSGGHAPLLSLARAEWFGPSAKPFGLSVGAAFAVFNYGQDSKKKFDARKNS